MSICHLDLTMERRFSPRELLKSRRPERFSDSVLEEVPALDRSTLEYHLDTLTNRSQEAEFQRFAFELAKREVCPNLLPQTGPTGGGDSKVDTETYPVADNLSLVWHVGIAREASTERWGFAISAKKDWPAKLKMDIAKIAGTGRSYAKAFFITNQFVRDKGRAKTEDELRTKHRLDVRILDRSWILDRVFAGRHESLAIEHLGLAPSLCPRRKQGPLDLQKERELEAIEERIKAATQEGRLGFELVADCIEAAILARSLERPRTEVEGYFLRAERVAKDHGTQHQRLRAAYDRAWTVFWWYEDYKSFANFYDAVETLAKGSLNAHDLELLTTLWICLHSMVRTGELTDDNALLRVRTDSLATDLERLSKEEERPSAMLQARTQRLHMRFQIAAFTGSDVDPILREFQEVVRECDGLVGYPLEPLVEIVTELGQSMVDRPAYEQLFESVTQIASRRKGEVAAARMLLKRGVQQLEADRPYDAIRSLGRALGSLYKHESRQDIVRALYFCGCAYEQVGLLWAARGSALTAASIATGDFWAYGEITGLQGACYDELKWIELQLGRVPHVLAWHEIDQFIKPQLVKEGMNEKRLSEREMWFNVILGMLLLKSDLTQLGQLTLLPDTLDRLGLVLAADALRFALGHKVDLPSAVIPEGATDNTDNQFFGRWRDQPAFEDLPEHPAIYADPTVTLRSILLGCRIEVETIMPRLAWSLLNQH